MSSERPLNTQYNIYIDNSTHVAQGTSAYQPYTLLQPSYHVYTPLSGYYPVQHLAGHQQLTPPIPGRMLRPAKGADRFESLCKFSRASQTKTVYPLPRNMATCKEAGGSLPYV